MHAVDLIRQTLDMLFAQYRHYTRSMFFLSFSVILAIALLTLLVIIPVFGLMGFLEVGTGSAPILQQLYYPESLYRIRLQNFSYATALFGMALFGYYLLRPDAQNKPLHSLTDIVKPIPAGRWPLFLVLLGGLYVLYAATFPYLFSYGAFSNDGWTESGPSSPFMQWFDSFFEMLKSYFALPVVFVAIIYLYEGKLPLRKYAPAMLASFILIFAFDSVWDSIRSLFQTYFMGLISLPFQELVYPTLLGMIAQVTFMTFLAVANSVALVYPFHRVYESSLPQEPEQQSLPDPL